MGVSCLCECIGKCLFLAFRFELDVEISRGEAKNLFVLCSVHPKTLLDGRKHCLKPRVTPRRTHEEHRHAPNANVKG